MDIDHAEFIELITHISDHRLVALVADIKDLYEVRGKSMDPIYDAIRRAARGDLGNGLYEKLVDLAHHGTTARNRTVGYGTNHNALKNFIETVEGVYIKEF